MNCNSELLYDLSVSLAELFSKPVLQTFLEKQNNLKNSKTVFKSWYSANIQNWFSAIYLHGVPNMRTLFYTD